jgi:hypothetical protein
MNASYLVSAINIYPVKGLGGIALNESYVTIKGLKYDRRWMIVDEQNQFISQRNFPHLCLFKIEIVDLGFQISFHESNIVLPFEIEEGQAVNVKIWNDEVSALKANEIINDFFSELLRIKCSLVFMPNYTNRWIDKSFVNNNLPVSFADGYPILMIGQASLNLLNSKLEKPMLMDRFRPNIVFEGAEPHQEDLWNNFIIGSVFMQGVKPCARCQVITINQQDATTNKEPLKTLSSYRNFDHKINFGQNVISKNEGVIKIGDSIIINN